MTSHKSQVTSQKIEPLYFLKGVTQMDRNDAILQTTPESKYHFLIEEILADKASMWKNDIYKETNKSSYDPIVGKLQNRIDTLRLTMKENRKVMDKII